MQIPKSDLLHSYMGLLREFLELFGLKMLNDEIESRVAIVTY